MTGTPRERILSDCRQFDQAVKEVKAQNALEEKILDLAKRYNRDALFFCEKQDYITAFGAANYAHGLLDALRVLKGLKHL